MPAWYETLFDARYLRFYPELLELDVAEREAAFIDRALALAPGATILDLGCGFGRHSVALAKLGFRVTGVDLSQPMLNAAAKLAGERAVTVSWVRRDLRDLAGLGSFAACVCLYTVLGYFDDEANEAVVASIHGLLSPGAPLLVDVSNPLALLPHLPHETWREGPYGVRLERTRYDAISGRAISDRMLVSAEGAKEELPESSVRLYTPSELRRMLERAGFELEAAYGALGDEPFVSLRSQKLVLLARRR
jgi:2-polyprenyl-3-methyl-5-hydroxy-6-metoxy-1,4-benzoquinol methylase